MRRMGVTRVSHDGETWGRRHLAGVVFLTFSVIRTGKDAGAPRFWDKLYIATAGL